MNSLVKHVLSRSHVMYSFLKGLMELIATIDTQTAMLYSLMYVSYSSVNLIQYVNFCGILIVRKTKFFFSIKKTDQYERFGWDPGTNLCWNWVCLQTPSTLWI